MRKTALFAAVCAALTLAGCDGGSSPAGAGAGSSEGSSSTVSEATAREKALTLARQNGMAVELQLPGLIIEAVQELRPRYQKQLNQHLDSIVCGLGLEPEKKAEARQVIEKEIGEIIIPGMELGIFATGEQADFNAACLASIWAASMLPMNGWPSADEGMAKWGATQLGIAVGTSQGMAPIANSLSKMPGATVDELKAKARELLTLNANNLRQQLGETVRGIAARDGEVSLDLTGSGPAPIHFTLAEMDYQRGANGSLVSRHGMSLYGNGYLEGARYTVEAVMSSGATMTRNSTSTASADNTNTTNVKAEARTQ